MKKKGLVIIYDPHALLMFLQYYCMDNHSDIRWDVLCLPKENGKQEMDKYCEKTGIFDTVYISETEFLNASMLKKALLFMKMLFFAIVRKQRAFSKWLFNTMVDDIESYDYYAANTESGLMAGLLASFAKDKTTIYFEDGAADYVFERKKNQSIYKKGSFGDFQCVAVAKMGYCGKGYTYFEPTKYCYKYATNPNELRYKNYKMIYKIRLEHIELDNFRQILQKVYPEIVEISEVAREYDLVMTMPLAINNKYREKYKESYIEYIKKNSEKICLKRHPRDTEEYDFGSEGSFYEIPQDIPAEVIIPFFAGKTCYMMEPDSTILSMGEYKMKAIILNYADYTAYNNLQINHWNSKKSFTEYCDRFIRGQYAIIDI